MLCLAMGEGGGTEVISGLQETTQRDGAPEGTLGSRAGRRQACGCFCRCSCGRCWVNPQGWGKGSLGGGAPEGERLGLGLRQCQYSQQGCH